MSCASSKFDFAHTQIINFPFQNQNSLSEIEKREKRAMERKLSEMEEELKVSFFVHYHNLTYTTQHHILIQTLVASIDNS